ncbi:hypothetical protein [Bordetella tumulicola]|uniref:hypothetical protein n=1 Tax=Bordetella tumulicola TaxID=1649133 RepID=UPI0039EE159B
MAFPRDTGLRTLCVPVRRPRHLTLLSRTAMASAALCTATAVWWQVRASSSDFATAAGRMAWPSGLAIVAGAGAIAVRRSRRKHQALRGAGHRALPVRALRASAGSRQWQVRQGGYWRPVTLHDSRRGPCWLELRLQADRAAGEVPLASYKISIWQTGMSTDCWRRLCLLAGAAQRLNAPEHGGAS